MTHIGNNAPIQATVQNIKALKKLDAADGKVDGKISQTESLKKSPELANTLAELNPEDAASVRQILDSETSGELLIQFPTAEKAQPKAGTAPSGVPRLQTSELSPALAERLEARKSSSTDTTPPTSLSERMRVNMNAILGIQFPEPEKKPEPPTSETATAPEMAPEMAPDTPSTPRMPLSEKIRVNMNAILGIQIPEPEKKPEPPTSETATAPEMAPETTSATAPDTPSTPRMPLSEKIRVNMNAILGIQIPEPEKKPEPPTSETETTSATASDTPSTPRMPLSEKIRVNMNAILGIQIPEPEKKPEPPTSESEVH